MGAVDFGGMLFTLQLRRVAAITASSCVPVFYRVRAAVSTGLLDDPVIMTQGQCPDMR